MVFRTRSWPPAAHPRSRQRAEVCWCTASSNRRQLNSLHHQTQPTFGEHPDPRYRRYPQAPHSNWRFQPVIDCRKASGIGDDNTPGQDRWADPAGAAGQGAPRRVCTHCVHRLRTNPSLTIRGRRLCCPESPRAAPVMAIDPTEYAATVVGHDTADRIGRPIACDRFPQSRGISCPATWFSCPDTSARAMTCLLSTGLDPTFRRMAHLDTPSKISGPRRLSHRLTDRQRCAAAKLVRQSMYACRSDCARV